MDEPDIRGGYNGVGRVLIVIPILVALILVLGALAFGSAFVFEPHPDVAPAHVAAARSGPSPGSS